MAAGLMGLLRSIANILGASSAAVLWDVRYRRHIQHYAENAPVDAFGLTTAMREVQSALVWSGELATQLSTKTMAFMHRRLLAEASTAAWQDYLLCNVLLALVAILPALLINSRLWRRSQPAKLSDQPAEAPAERQTQP